MLRSLMLLLTVGCLSANEPALLQEKSQSAEHFDIQLRLRVEGKLLLTEGDKPKSVANDSTASLQYLERTEQIENGQVGKVLRHYREAKSHSAVGTEESRKELRPERRLIFVHKKPSGPTAISPDGPLEREELDLIGEHLDTSILPRLLPDKEVRENDRWTLNNSVAQAICQFDAVVSNELRGTVTKITQDEVLFKIEGTAEGLELGARAKVLVEAEGRYSRTTGRIAALTWSQVDQRAQGPASPAAEVRAKIEVQRQFLKAQPGELAKVDRKKLLFDEIPLTMTYLSHTDPDGSFSFKYPREWLIVGRTQEFLVLRWLEKEQLLAQVTLARWKKAETGQHTPAKEFLEAVQKVGGWKPGEVQSSSEIPWQSNWWLYRHVAKGTVDNKPVLQSFYLLAAPTGGQLAITVLTTPEHADKLQDGETRFLRSIELPAKK